MADGGWGVVLRLPWLWLVERLPKSILRGRYPPQVVAENLGIDIRHARLTSLLTPGLPSIDLQLRYVNLNPFWVTVAWLRFEISVSHQPMVQEERRSDRRIEAHRAVPKFAYGQSLPRDEQVHFEFHIDTGRAEFVRNQPDSWRSGLGLQVRLSLSGDSAAGEWSRKNLEFYMSGDQVPGLH